VKNALICGLVVILVVLGYPFVRKALRSAPRPAVQEQTQRPSERKIITLAQFNQIQNGMKYEQVVGILGEEGSLEGEQKETDDFRNEIVLRQYSWKNGGVGGFMDVTFANGVVAMKTQYGLK
jgi:hypothetical protein